MTEETKKPTNPKLEGEIKQKGLGDFLQGIVTTTVVLGFVYFADRPFWNSEWKEHEANEPYRQAIALCEMERTASCKEHYKKALPLLEEAANINPLNSSAYAKLAIAHADLGHPNTAQKNLKEGVDSYNYFIGQLQRIDEDAGCIDEDLDPIRKEAEKNGAIFEGKCKLDFFFFGWNDIPTFLERHYLNGKLKDLYEKNDIYSNYADDMEKLLEAS